jgi:nitroreductase
LTLLEIAQTRRSVRRYEDRPIEPEKIRALLETAERARRAFGAFDSGLLLVDEPKLAGRLRRAIVSGWKGKINPWIYVTPFPAVLVLLGRPDGRPDAHGQPLYLAPAAMVMETVMLAAAELGLGTCWVAGFNDEAVIGALELTGSWRPIIVSPLGYPAQQGRLARLPRAVAQSDRRKPLAEVFELHGDWP